MVGKKENRIGFHFGKYDWDRCGLFIDMGYGCMGEKYIGPKLCNRSACKGKQPSVQLPKENNGFFDTFQSLYVNDKYVDVWKKNLIKQSKSRKWKIAGDAKRHATPGDNFGTFTTDYTAFSPSERPKIKEPKTLKSFIINPSKKGGPGYIGYTFSQWDYISDGLREKRPKDESKIMRTTFPSGSYLGKENPYAPVKLKKKPQKIQKEKCSKTFHMAYPKKPGNNHDGCFSPYPKWIPSKSKPKKKENKKSDKKIQLWGGYKSFYVVSIINHKIKSACHAQNYQNFKPITYPL